MSKEESRKDQVANQTALLVVVIFAYIATSALIRIYLSQILPRIGLAFLLAYIDYINIGLALAFGFFIVSIFANIVYWSTFGKYGHSTAASLRNLFRLIGIGAMIAAIAGGVAGGASGVALGGFLGIVVGFASQQVLGQVLAGVLLSVARPFKIDDRVNISSEDGIVEGVSTLFTQLKKDDGTKVLVPNNSIIGNKIFLKNETLEASAAKSVADTHQKKT